METSAKFCHIFPVTCSRDAVAKHRSGSILSGITVFIGLPIFTYLGWD